MDAVRLVEMARRALARARDLREIVTEAWQVQALTEAVGSHLAIHGPVLVQAAALALAETGSRACEALRPPELRIGDVRARRLTGVGDGVSALCALRDLLAETGVALVAVTCAVEEEPAYWSCVDAVDAVDEAGERVAELLRLLDGPSRGTGETEWGGEGRDPAPNPGEEAVDGP